MKIYKQMKRIIFVLLMSVAFHFLATAQSYQTGVGLRGGFSNGITVKHFISEGTAVEGILSTRWRGFLITGLYELEKSTAVNGLDWYYGVGGHIGVWNNNRDNNPFTDDGGATILGIDGILGIEYTFGGIPINLSLDWKPAFNLIGSTGFWGDSGALSIRYVF